jgi:hypothetical protein
MLIFSTPRTAVLFDDIRKTILHNYKSIRHPLTAGVKKEEVANSRAGPAGVT